MKLGSVFDGIGGFPLAGMRHGFEPVWASEIEPFPIRVTTQRFPNMRHVGDITMLNGAELEPVDVICGGSPCQDLSIAGKKKGMKHADLGNEETTRSGLFMEQVRRVKEMRDATDGIYPRFMVWENVTGAFSSNEAEDFRAVLEETARIADCNAVIPRPPGGTWQSSGAVMGNGWSIAWRVSDAQFWGVPQRRRRIFLVADFGGHTAPEILFKREGLRRHIEEGRSEGERIAADAERGAGAASFTMQERAGKPGGGKGILIQEEKASALRNYQQAVVWPDVSNTLTRRMDGSPCIDRGPQIVAYGIGGYNSEGMLSSNPHAGIYEADTARTLDLNGGNPACNQGGIAIVQPSVYDMAHAFDVIRECGDTVSTLQNRMGTGGNQIPLIMEHSQANAEPMVARMAAFGKYKADGTVSAMKQRDYKDATDLVVSIDCRNMRETNVHGTLQAKENGGQSLNYMGAVRTGYAVRRLMPIECARLQGFPDWWMNNLGTDNPTDAELDFWQEVFKTHAAITDSKPKTRKAIKAWLKDPTSDSAEYKAYGNSVAIPCVEYVMEGIAEVLRRVV